MSNLTFPELQQKMQLEKKKAKDVKYAFRNAEDIYTAFKELKSEWIVILTDELFELSERVFVKAVATATKGDEVYTSTAFAELGNVPVLNTQKGQFKQMQEPQWTGAVSSYARKYALQGLFAIGEKDVDEYPIDEQEQQAQNQQAAPHTQGKLIDNVQYQAINELVSALSEAKGVPFDTVANFILQKYGLSDFHKVQADSYDAITSFLSEQLDKAKAKKGK
jgi:hypothetical protein